MSGREIRSGHCPLQGAGPLTAMGMLGSCWALNLSKFVWSTSMPPATRRTTSCPASAAAACTRDDGRRGVLGEGGAESPPPPMWKPCVECASVPRPLGMRGGVMGANKSATLRTCVAPAFPLLSPPWADSAGALASAAAGVTGASCSADSTRPPLGGEALGVLPGVGPAGEGGSWGRLAAQSELGWPVSVRNSGTAPA